MEYIFTNLFHLDRMAPDWRMVDLLPNHVPEHGTDRAAGGSRPDHWGKVQRWT